MMLTSEVVCKNLSYWSSWKAKTKTFRKVFMFESNPNISPKINIVENLQGCNIYY